MQAEIILPDKIYNESIQYYFNEIFPPDIDIMITEIKNKIKYNHSLEEKSKNVHIRVRLNVMLVKQLICKKCPSSETLTSFYFCGLDIDKIVFSKNKKGYEIID